MVSVLPVIHERELHSRPIAPLECFITQGEHALPPPVIEKFAKTGGQLSKNVFLLREWTVNNTHTWF